ATYTGAVATGVASGGEQWKNDQLRVFTPAGGQQLASDVMQYGAQAPAVWTTQSVLNSGQQLATTTESFVGAQRYDSPAMASNAAESATPLVLDGTRNYVSTMYGAAGVSFSGLGPVASTTQWAPSAYSPAGLKARAFTQGGTHTNSVVIGRNMDWVREKALELNAGIYTGTPIPAFARKLMVRVTPTLLKRIDLAHNRAWINAQMAAQRTIYDVGSRPGTNPGPSPAYAMERYQTRNYSGSMRYK
ncbi:hypothetical protein LGT39_00470, partial [Demequina sp. TTPB684]